MPNARCRRWKERHVRPHDAARAAPRAQRALEKHTREAMRRAAHRAKLRLPPLAPPFPTEEQLRRFIGLMTPPSPPFPCAPIDEAQLEQLRRLRGDCRYDPCCDPGAETRAALRAVQDGTATNEQRRLVEMSAEARAVIGLPPLEVDHPPPLGPDFL